MSKLRPEFVELSRVTSARSTTLDELTSALLDAEAMPQRRREAEAAVHRAALRRYELLTGSSWHASRCVPAASSWGGQSSHRFKLSERGRELLARCSCGASRVVETSTDAASWHVSHIAVTHLDAGASRHV